MPITDTFAFGRLHDPTIQQAVQIDGKTQPSYKCLGFYFFIELVLLFTDRNDIAAKAHNLGNKESLHLCFSSSTAVLGNQQINLLWQRVLRFNDFKAYIGVLNNGATLASPAIIVKLR
jgi:hypothetical protein